MTEAFLRRAIDLAVENVHSGGGPFGAVVVKDGRIVAEGANCVTATNDPTAHAEIVAIRNACVALGSFQLTGCDIYASCEPCPMCLGAIYWARPDRVYYAATQADAAAAGFDDGFIYREIMVEPQARTIPFVATRLEGSLSPFETWSRTSLKTRY